MKPGWRSNSVKKMKKRLPSGKSVVHLKKEKPGRPTCSGCSGELHGLPRLKPIRMANITKSKRTINRMFGSDLCGKCTKSVLKSSVRGGL